MPFLKGLAQLNNWIKLYLVVAGVEVVVAPANQVRELEQEGKAPRAHTHHDTDGALQHAKPSFKTLLLLGTCKVTDITMQIECFNMWVHH